MLGEATLFKIDLLPFEKGSTLKGKNLRANSFLFEKTYLFPLELLKMYIL